MLWEKALPLSPYLICAKKQRNVVGCQTELGKRNHLSQWMPPHQKTSFVAQLIGKEKQKDSGLMDWISFLFLLPSFSLSPFFSFTSTFHHLAMFHLLSPELCFPSFINHAA